MAQSCLLLSGLTYLMLRISTRSLETAVFVGGVLCPAAALIYGRLLGRLAWRMAKEERRIERRAERERDEAIAARTGA